MYRYSTKAVSRPWIFCRILAIRTFADKPKYNAKPNLQNIDSFNKSKSSYLFGQNFDSLDDLNKKTDPKEIQKKVRENFEREADNDVNAMLENDPRLQAVPQSSPEYKELLHQIHQEYQEYQKKQRSWYEFNERMKGVGMGLFCLVAIVTGHQVFMNYGYIKGKILANINYKIDESKAADLSDPLKNTKTMDFLVNKLAEQLAGDVIENLKDSSTVPGLYLFGSNGNRLPIRMNFFDNMLIKDVKLSTDLVAVVNDKGQLYQVYQNNPQLVNLPFKVEKCEISRDYIYLLTNKGEVAYVPRLDKQAQFEPLQSRNWVGLSKQNSFNKIDNVPSVKDISVGEHHLLMLSAKGSLYMASTTPEVDNYGQFGLPDLSPLTQEGHIPTNVAFEMTLLNNEVVNKDGIKTLAPRVFTSIASGKYHNIVTDSSSIWTWGRNIYGECGIDISYKTDYQAIPREVLITPDYQRLCRNVVKGLPEDFSVAQVLATNDTSYFKLRYSGKDSQDVLFSFGNGVKGQLGNNRFLHVCSQPQLVKSLINLTEYNEEDRKVTNIGIKNISAGNNHLFVTLQNAGNNDVLVFGDNEFGQFGNGKIAKTSKPSQIPKLIEPVDLKDADPKNKRVLVRKLNNVITSRLQLLHDEKIGRNEVEQIIVAGENSSAIFYKRK